MKLSIMTILRFVLVALAMFASLASPAQARGPSDDQAAAGRKFAERV